MPGPGQLLDDGNAIAGFMGVAGMVAVVPVAVVVLMVGMAVGAGGGWCRWWVVPASLMNLGSLWFTASRYHAPVPGLTAVVSTLGRDLSAR